MKYNYEFDMKYTDNPYIDIIVQCVKILGMNAVVKNENQALHYEDARSAKMATDYISFKEGTWDKKKGVYWEEKYFEWNSYYRMLYGLPPAYSLADENAYLDATGYDDSIYEDIGNAYVIPELYRRYFIDMGQYEIPEEMQLTFDLTGKYLHELSEEELSMIESSGIMKQILSDYGEDSHYQYIYHLGDKRVDYYTARKAPNFTLLWVPELDTFDIIENKFKRIFDRNRKYTIAAVYSEAYRFMSYHYDSFIEILIIIQTMVDMISEVQEYIINKDVFDSRTIRYLFESYGIAYYKEIPVKYQIRIIKNVNNLLKYKSSNKNIIDILELFDNSDISIYTFYLMKTKKLNREDFFFYTADDVNPKYGTNRDYWIGPNTDISNNKVPLTNVKYNTDDSKFINTHIYNYELIDKTKEDRYSNRKLTEEQIIASMISKQLDSVSVLQPTNSFIDGYMRGSAVNWFDIDKYNSTTQDYLKYRNDFLYGFGVILAERIKKYFDILHESEPNLGLNGYFYRRIKYELYAALGLLDPDIPKSENFDNMSDSELISMFYQSDTIIDDKYFSKHDVIDRSLPEYEYREAVELYKHNNEDRFILNHTIPYMTLFDYKMEDEEILEDTSNNHPYYIFQNSSSFTVTPDWYPDTYEKWTRIFRESYIIAVRSYIEGIFSGFEHDELNNPSPKYIGWMDIGYVVTQLGKKISEFEIGDMVTTKGHDNIPIYNSSYISEVITKDMIGQEFFRKNYDLCFLKVPILESNAYELLDRFDLRRNYDTITLADPFWDGVTTFDLMTQSEREKLHLSKKQEILNQDFTIERTKYIGVEASIDLTKASYQICYFMNMLYDKHRDEELLMLDVSKDLVSSGRVRLNDLLTFALALNYMYQGVEPDNIASDMEKNMYINGFNFDTDWTDIYNYLEKQRHIYNNYLNDSDNNYTYTDEFGVEHTVENGYGMDQLERGWMVELYDSFIEYGVQGEDYVKIYSGDIINPDGSPADVRNYKDPNTKMPDDLRVGAFLSGRYEQCPVDCPTTEHLGLNFGESDIWNYNLCNAVKFDWTTGKFSTIDISWKPTQYPNDDNNSHGLWMSTDILAAMSDNVSDLERINMLKKIYYTNTNLYDHLTYMMKHAESKRMYDIYKVLYDSFMETKLNHDFYRIVNNAGVAVYTDVNRPDSTYVIAEKISYIKDNEGFPVYELVDSVLGSIPKKYYFSHNADFTDCKYISEDNTDIVECLYIESKVIRYGIKEYYVSDDLPDDFPRGFMMPQNKYYDEDKSFILGENHQYVLQDKNNKKIIIPITVNIDESGITVDDFIIGTTVFEDCQVTVERLLGDDNIKVTIVYNDDPDNPIILTSDFSWKIAEDYYEYMQYRNLDLYNHMIDIKYNYNNVYDSVSQTYIPSDEKKSRIEYLCEMIIDALEQYFDSSEWSGIFGIVPTANIQNIQRYIMKMVVFFKSWKTQTIDTTVSYTMNDPNGNYVHILDDMYYNAVFTMLEKFGPKDYKYFHVYTDRNDKVTIGEKVDLVPMIFEPYWTTFGFGEKIYGHRFDYPVFNSTFEYRDKIGPREKLEINTIAYTGDVTQDANGNYLFP